jgi:mRNA interferase MazF
MNAGDIVLVRFPEADLQPGKLRPALVVAMMPGYDNDVLLAMISSKLRQALSGFDEIIQRDDQDYINSGLKLPSVIRLTRLISVANTIPMGRLGSISPQRLTQIRQRLSNWLLSTPSSL